MTRTLVRLEPPYTRSYGSCGDTQPLTRGPRLIRGRASGRWHRPRSGIYLATFGRTVFRLWCGQAVHFADALTATTLPDDEPLCGTCEGRACGAGYPATDAPMNEALLFEPVSSAPPPARCPSYRLGEWQVRDLPLRGVVDGSVRCGCGAPTRAVGS